MSAARQTLSLAILLSFFGISLYAEDPYQKPRQEMIEKDLKGRGIQDSKVLAVMAEIPRHLFVPKDLQRVAYSDRPLPIGEGQTISQPYVVAYMTEALGLKGGERVLEIGAGSGYQAAVLARTVREVFTVEIRKGLAKESAERLRSMKYQNVWLRHADGYFGWEEKAPFDAIMITAAANHIPRPLLKQLKEGGRLILPLGSTRFYQTLVRITKRGERFESERLIDVRFVPMTGRAEKETEK